MIMRIIVGVLIVSGLGLLLAWSQWRIPPQKISGFIEGDEIRLGSRVGGRVLKIHVQEGQFVQAGTVMVELEPFDLPDLHTQAAELVRSREADLARLVAGSRPEEIAQAKAKRDELATHLAELKAGPRKETIDAAKARLDSARAEETYSRQSFQKIKDSLEHGAATQEEMDKSTHYLRSTQAVRQMREAELAELMAGTRQEDITMAEAQLEQADQAWRLAKAGAQGGHRLGAGGGGVGSRRAEGDRFPDRGVEDRRADLGRRGGLHAPRRRTWSAPTRPRCPSWTPRPCGCGRSCPRICLA